MTPMDIDPTYCVSNKAYGPEMPDPDFVVRMLPKIHAAYVRKKGWRRPFHISGLARPPHSLRTHRAIIDINPDHQAPTTIVCHEIAQTLHRRRENLLLGHL